MIPKCYRLEKLIIENRKLKTIPTLIIENRFLKTIPKHIIKNRFKLLM